MPPYRRYGPGVSAPADDSTDAKNPGSEKVDVLAQALESLRVLGGLNSADDLDYSNGRTGSTKIDTKSGVDGKSKAKGKSPKADTTKTTRRRLSSASNESASSFSSDETHDDGDYVLTGSSTSTTPPSGSEEDNLSDKQNSKISPILTLPNELLEMIFFHVPPPMSVEILFVCRRFYHMGLACLYEHPRLNVRNYHKFVAAISGSSSSASSSSSQIMKGNRGYINRNYHAEDSNHGKNLGSLVKVLDLRNIIQSGKNSYTARVLRRCSSHLQQFLAPQTSFGYSPLVSLRACSQLKVLDLSLVSETVDLRLLFSAISNAQHLEKLAFPRSSIFCHEYDNIWPPKLWQLCLSGGICNDFMMATTFPSTVTELVITHCPFINGESVRSLCARLGSQLHTLRVFYPMPALRPDAMDPILGLCPNLKSLSISVDYISRHMFEDIRLEYDSKTKEPIGHGLRHLCLDSSGMLGQSHKLEPMDISLAILDEKLPKLSKVQVSLKLGWNPKNEDMIELAEILSDKNGGVWVA